MAFQVLSCMWFLIGIPAPFHFSLLPLGQLSSCLYWAVPRGSTPQLLRIKRGLGIWLKDPTFLARHTLDSEWGEDLCSRFGGGVLGLGSNVNSLAG